MSHWKRAGFGWKGVVAVVVAFGAWSQLQDTPGAGSEPGCLDFDYGRSGLRDDWVQAIRVDRPWPRSEVQGDTIVRFRASGMDRAKVMVWQQPTRAQPDAAGHDVNLSPQGIALSEKGRGSILLPADRFPHGPLALRIYACNTRERTKDIYELQLFNRGGVLFRQGIPASTPGPAKELPLLFSDDFDRPLSISADGRGARYCAHKPPAGDFSGWPFSDPLAPGKPFSQVETWLRISAQKAPDAPEGITGLIASINMDGEGIWVRPPAYLEARLVAQSAPGTWPAFWTLTHADGGTTCDELDIVEAYGGVGAGQPNHPGYTVASHFWGQKGWLGLPLHGHFARPEIMRLGSHSYWSTTFHTYGVHIGLDETAYYFDDIEVLRHPTNRVSRGHAHFFLINYAIGGASGWSIDLARYGNGSDLYVDYVRVYGRAPRAKEK